MSNHNKQIEFLSVGLLTDFPEGKSKRVIVGSSAVALFHTVFGFFAIEDACSHQGSSLSFGSVNGFCVACPRHGAIFDIRNGNVLSLPALRGVKRYEVKIEGDQLMVSTSPVPDCEPELLRL